MKILWILEKELDSSFSSSGRFATLQELEKNHHLTIVTGYRNAKVNIANFKSRIIYIDSVKYPILKRIIFYKNQIRFIKKFCHTGNADIILVNSFNYFLIRILIKRRHVLRTLNIFDVRTLPVDSSFIRRLINGVFFNLCLKYSAKYFHGITYITEEMRRYCINKYTLVNHKNQIWSSGVDIKIFKKFNKSGNYNRDDRFNIIYHGALAKNRKISNVILAIKSINTSIPINFGVMGAGDGLKELKMLVSKLDLDSNVSFIDPVSHHIVPQVINSYHAGILPFPYFHGWNTSSPIKLFEYLACEKPVIVTKIPAHSQVLSNKRFAFWANESSPEALAEAIMEAYKSRGQFASLGVEARQFAKENYTWEKQTARLDKFFRDLK